MGGVICCDRPEKNNQILIEQIKPENKLKITNSKRKFLMTAGIDMKKLKILQATIKSYLTKKKFYKYFDIMKKITIEELKVSRSENNIEEYLNDAKMEMEKISKKIEKYESSQYYKMNIKRLNNNNFVIKFPAIYVNRVHNNDIYEGMWNIDKKFHGYGILIKSDGSKYQGIWESGLINGIGRFYTQTGDLYDGNFIKGIACGYGKFFHKDGTIYKGEWQNDQPHGKGIEYFTDGSYFDGTFYNGKKNGMGQFSWADGSTYSGQIQNELFEGNGKYIWADGRIYEGCWKNNQMHGLGLLIYADGTFYDGEFFNNLRHGQGKYQWSDYKYFEGTWSWGKQNGKGLFFKNGQITEGIWNNGKLMNRLSSPNNENNSPANSKDNKSSIISNNLFENNQLKKQNTNSDNPNANNILMSTKTKSLKKFSTAN
jgi:hypothetical protein